MVNLCMEKLKKELDRLDDQKRSLLMYAFEQGLSQYVEIRDGFIGVNVENIEHLEIIEQKGAWSYGRIRKPVA